MKLYCGLGTRAIRIPGLQNVLETAPSLVERIRRTEPAPAACLLKQVPRAGTHLTQSDH